MLESCDRLAINGFELVAFLEAWHRVVRWAVANHLSGTERSERERARARAEGVSDVRERESERPRERERETEGARERERARARARVRGAVFSTGIRDSKNKEQHAS
eukprot:2752988-Rhodomonas_salina.1